MNFLDWVYPPACMACRQLLSIEDKERRRARLCAPCEKLFVPIKPPVCKTCGVPFEIETETPPSYCASCRGAHFHFESNIACFEYGDLIREVIHEIKYRKRMQAAIGCGVLWAANISAEKFEGIDFVVPVPMHAKKIRERGFNQTLVMTEELAKAFGFKPAPRLLKRVANTPPLSGLNPRRRAEVLSGAFEVNKKFDVRDKRILLTDDIYTTGSTLSACAKVLKDAGTKEVFCVTFAAAALKDKNN